jgi:hypothetical protein
VDIYVLDEDERSITLKLSKKPPMDFPTALELFGREVDKTRLMSDALGRRPEDAARGVIEELVALAQLWGRWEGQT